MISQLVLRAHAWRERTALEKGAVSVTYGELLDASAGAAAFLLNGTSDLQGARVVFAVAPGPDYVASQWAIWRAGGVAVPISAAQAPAEWEYIIRDTGAGIVLSDGDADAVLQPLAESCGARFAGGRDSLRSGLRALPAIAPDRDAMILYTSGTTGRPKGVVTTHAGMEAQVRMLVDAWRWTPDDRILDVLPLNHVHGIVNVLGCALWAGATCEFLWPFDATAVWQRFAAGRLTLFMAVPTIYAKLLSAWNEADVSTRTAWSEGARRLRLMVSGSAALPATVLEGWKAATGHVLLERYGMTEIGMALSNPLAGARRPGHVGVPLPGVEVRVVDDAGVEVPAGTPGEIEVRGPAVFREYWRRPEATRAAFRNGWFRTGDVGVVDEGAYRILGRQSADIIKTGGYKVSALEIEEVLRDHPAVRECAVVGIEDDEWGERVAAAVVPRAGQTATLDGLREWAAARLAKYKLPTRLVVVEDLPRNAMGKVTKRDVRRLFKTS